MRRLVMRYGYGGYPGAVLRLGLLLAAFLSSLFLSTWAEAFNINVVDGNGIAITGGFHYLVEEDNTFPVSLNTFDPTSLTANIHKSYAPAILGGSSTNASATVNLPADRRYMVSVLPDSGYTVGGANAAIGQNNVTVTVIANPILTAQISVHVFEDSRAISGVKDIPAEGGLPNFTILVFDVLGQVSTDVWGNPLGTTYQQPYTDPPVVQQLGSGIVTDANGDALIKNLPPGIYTVSATPTDGQPWVQTVTVGGGPNQVTWVRSGEPPVFTQGGILNKHIFIGFVKVPYRDTNLLPFGTGTIMGRVVNTHSTRPPAPQIYAGRPVPECYVGLNTSAAGQELGVLAQACNPDGTFAIPNVPPGVYQLVSWDRPLDNLMSVRVVTIGAGQTIDMGDMPTGRWFGTLEGSVFYDANENGYRDCVTATCDVCATQQCSTPGVDDEIGVQNSTINLRARDGSIAQSVTTDAKGFYSLFEVGLALPRWQVAEVDYLRYKATGATIVVDDGGPLAPLPVFHPDGIPINTPQAQPDNGGLNFRTETTPAPVLLEGMIVHPDQINIIDWGKANYAPGENGGIAGIVFYSTTRAENDPRYAAGEPWEPAIPYVQVNLYRDSNNNGIIDDVNNDGMVTLADVDNYPLGNFPGPEDVDRNGNGVFNAGDAINVVNTDSSDEILPTGCVGPAQFVNGVPLMDCVETLQTWNQVRPTVFDGGYIFLDYVPGGVDTGNTPVPLPSGIYIVEAVPPPGYITVKEEDKNVDFGDSFLPVALPYPCVGDPHLVPAQLTMDVTGTSGLTSPFAGQIRPLCDRKQVTLTSGQNAPADFHLFTFVPKSGRIVGVLANPLANATNPQDPNFGGPLGLSWVPVSILDFQGNLLALVYTDEWGSFNALVPSTNRINVPTPSGVSPNVVNVCSNAPSTDPQFDPRFGSICTQVDVFPGRTSYIPAVVNAVGGFVSAPATGVLDCELPDKTPRIYSVSNNNASPPNGPYVSVADGSESVTITSMGAGNNGMVSVKNPKYDPINNPGSTQMVMRDYGFGTVQGSVTVGGVPLTVTNWTNTSITATVPGGVSTGQLIITRADNGIATEVGVTLHVGGSVFQKAAGQTIQDAINSTPPNSLLLIPPGIYSENLVMWKPLSLQGYGAGSTIIDAGSFTPAKQAAWTAEINNRVTSGAVTLIPGQRADFSLEQGAGITVLGDDPPNFVVGTPARIDGFTIRNASGANSGGGILVNGYAHYLQITNNIIGMNQGNFGGGIRLGWSSIVTEPGTCPDANPLNCIQPAFQSSFNDNIAIHNNHFNQNGSLNDGGGIAIFNGADSYALTDNFMCGNYSALNGGAVGHMGLSDNGLISDNRLVFNEAFGEGGAIILAGELVPTAVPAIVPPGVDNRLTPGAGNVTINSNLIQGNLGGDDGGGISIVTANGQSVLTTAFEFNILNNFISNNASGLSGGGINLADTVNVNVFYNTITKNDSMGFAGLFAGGNLTQTVPMAGGLTARALSTSLQAVLTAASSPFMGDTFTNPAIQNNIFWQNRSFFLDTVANGGLGAILPNPVNPYWDMQVFGTATPQFLNPLDCIMTYTTDPFPGLPTPLHIYSATNTAADPMFLSPYFNTILYSQANALGNFSTFEPLTLTGDYHITSGSPAQNNSGILPTTPAALSMDYDGEARTTGAGTADSGADEWYDFATITTNTGIGGMISPSGVIRVPSTTSSYSFSITPNSGYTVANVLVDGVPQGAISSYTFTGIVAGSAHTISATFNLQQHTITVSAGPNGTISPAGPTVLATPGTNVPFTITPNLGYRVQNVLVDGVSVGQVTSYQFSNVQANHTISASFAVATYAITASASAGGAISPSGVIMVNGGGSQTFNIASSAGFHIADVLVDNVSVGAVTSYQFTNVQANHTISASFAPDVNLVISVTVGPNGTISPPGPLVTATPGSNVAFTITPNSGYHIASLVIDGAPITPTANYTFTNVIVNHTISVTFALNVQDKIGIFRGGAWELDSNGNGIWELCTTDLCRTFGLSADIPVAGDWDGNGVANIGVKRGANWYLDFNGNGVWDGCFADRCYTFGLVTDVPVVGDWNGSGTDKIGVFRNGGWYLDMNGNGSWNGCATDSCRTFGLGTDLPVVGNWDGAGPDKIGVFRNGDWYLDTSGNGSWNGCATDACRHFGTGGDAPIPGDWSGLGTSYLGVKRGTNWYLDSNGNGAWNSGSDTVNTYGMAADRPVVGKW